MSFKQNLKDFKEGRNIAKIVEKVLLHMYKYDKSTLSEEQLRVYHSRTELLDTHYKEFGYMAYASTSSAFLLDQLKTIEGLVS